MVHAAIMLQLQLQPLQCTIDPIPWDLRGSRPLVQMITPLSHAATHAAAIRTSRPTVLIDIYC